MAVTLAGPSNTFPPVHTDLRAERTAGGPPPMDTFVIDGGVALSGTVVPAGNKNAALPILAASVLTTEEVVVRNVPRIADVEAMIEVLAGLGVTVRWLGEHDVALCAADVQPDAAVERGAATRIRASFLLAGPLLARFGSAVMPPPGGDVIGRRRLDPHLDAFRALGATYEFRRDIHIDAPALSLTELRSGQLGESSATVRDRTERARQRQQVRFAGTSVTANARMTHRQIRQHCEIDSALGDLLQQAMEQLSLSARAYDRILKVARTIADLAASASVQADHVSEAIQLRSLDRQLWG